MSSPTDGIALFRELRETQGPPWLLWSAPGEDMLLAAGARTIHQPSEASEWRRWLPSLRPSANDGTLFFLLAFDPPAVPDRLWAGMPRAWAFEPQEILRIPATVEESSLIQDTPANGSGNDVFDEGYLHSVTAGLRTLHAGGLQKIVLSRRKTWSFTSDFDHLLQRVLAVRNAFRVLFSPDGEKVFLSITPERLVRVENGTAFTAAIAGTALRRSDGSDDHEASRTLSESRKEEEEHTYVVNMIHDALSGVSNGIMVGDRKTITLPHVHHLKTDITAQLCEGVRIGDVVALLHPTPAVAGVPRETAMTAIAEIEGFDRGLFAGVAGWMDGAGDGDAAVTIRSALLRDGTATVFAGAGIVRDSDPAVELAETEAKMRMVHDVLRPR
ncbi:MAG: chorismate-binding protein [Bacteroidia bacterium]|nr:chorismate-binding protein [Bacteroidia bacterium]